MTMSRNTAHVLLQCQQLENLNQRIRVDRDQNPFYSTYIHIYIYVIASKESMNQEHDPLLTKTQLFTVARVNQETGTPLIPLYSLLFLQLVQRRTLQNH